MLLVCLLAAEAAVALRSAPQAALRSSVAPRAGCVVLQSRGGVSDLSDSMRDMREAMAKDERTSAFVDAMRGTNLNDDDFAAADTRMQTVSVRGGEDSLPLAYDPEALAAYFSNRCRARRAWRLARGRSAASTTA